MLKNQQTIAKPISYTGVGLHTGNLTNMTFKPAPVNFGIRFKRIDLDDCPEIPAIIDYVVDISRGTSIGMGDVTIHTVEHILAAATGLEIDNLLVELDNNEPPVGDGSALPFVQALTEAGIVEQDSPKDYFVLDEKIAYSDEKKGIDIVVFPSDEFRITFMVDYQNPALGTQYTAMYSLHDEFVREFAPARTFCFLHEVEMLREANLARGGTLDNAIVIVDKDVDAKELVNLKELFNMENDVFLGDNGILNGKELRFYNEPVRHKTLDLIGDLALLGRPILAHVTAARSGHAANVELVKMLRKQVEKNEIVSKYKGKTSGKNILFDVEMIQKILPHRYPFLLVDRIIDFIPKEKAVGIKNVSFNEPFFQGHFPGHPIMPGVLIVEAMAQVAGVLLLDADAEHSDRYIYFTGIDKVRFRKTVVPGDQLRFEVEMVKRRRSICKVTGKAYVDGDLVCEAELMAAIVDN